MYKWKAERSGFLIVVAFIVFETWEAGEVKIISHKLNLVFISGSS